MIKSSWDGALWHNKWLRRGMKIWGMAIWLALVGFGSQVAQPAASRSATLLCQSETTGDFYYCVYTRDMFGNIWYICVRVT